MSKKDIVDKYGSEKNGTSFKINGSLFNKILGNIGDVIVIIDMQGVNRYKSPNMEKLFGWKPEEVIGRSALENVHPDDLEYASDFVTDLFQTPNATGTAECRYRCKDGSYRWIEFKGINLLHDPDINGILGNYRDITVRKEYAQELHQEKTLMDTLIDSLPGIFYMYTYPGRRLVKWNKNHEKILGYSPAELINRPLVSLHHEEDTELFHEAVEKVFQVGHNLIQSSLIHKDGRKIPFILTGEKFDTSEGSYLVGVGIEITDLQAAQEEKHKLQSQLAQSQKLEAIGRLAGGVAHDFNNMLSVILGYTEMVITSIEPNNPVMSDLKEIQKAASHSTELTKQLLGFARKQTITPKVAKLNEIVESLIKMLKRLLGENITLHWMPGRKLWDLKVDSTQIDQILANLMVNARDAIDLKGTITVQTYNANVDISYKSRHPDIEVGEYVVLSVKDDGRGMDNATLDRLFEPFFTTREFGQGTGMGLATIYGIIKQNHGFVDVYSQPGEGSEFKVYIPRYIPPISENSENAVQKASESEQRNIIIVEDEPALLTLGSSMLKRLGYYPISAATPSEAIALAENAGDKVHMLITDVVMPEINGRELAEKIKKIHPHIKILFMSGYSSDIISQHGILDESTNFIQKPFSMNALANKLSDAFKS